MSLYSVFCSYYPFSVFIRYLHSVRYYAYVRHFSARYMASVAGCVVIAIRYIYRGRWKCRKTTLIMSP